MVKICGITRIEDAQAAVDAGADALGFMFFERSKRRITPDAAAKIISQLPASVNSVGVFVNASEETIREAARVSGVQTVQFHGDESPEFCAALRPLKLWKAFRMENEESLTVVRQFAVVDAWLLDSFVPGAHGGTGETFNWNLAIAAKENGRPMILAGGLHADNVADAVRHVRPFGIDVSSGVESAPGVKDPAKIRAFIDAAKNA